MRIPSQFKIFIVFLFIVMISSGCKFVDKETREAMKPVTLNYWRVFDTQDSFAEVLANYKRIHPHISINYKTLRPGEYEKELLEAFAQDRGPDIFSIHNTWVTKYQSKLAALPETTTLPYQIVQGTIKKETITRLQTDPTITIRDLQEIYVPVVAGDVVRESLSDPNSKTGPTDEIYGLPLSVDSLVLYYNRDLLNEAGIVRPPRTWTQFQEAVQAIAIVDSEDEILTIAAGYGTASNVDRYFDIISLLMLQNGSQMIDSRGRATFDMIPVGSDLKELPASQALRFYTDFASPVKEVYTWNDEQKSSLEVFMSGDSAFFFGYSYHLPFLEAQASTVNLGVASMPQIGNNDSINYANYWVETVSKKTEYIDESWDFIQFITNPVNVEPYLKSTGKPPAVGSLIETMVDDLRLGVWAEQAATAQSWYTGFDIQAAENIFAEMIEETLRERADDNVNYTLLIERAVQKIKQTL